MQNIVFIGRLAADPQQTTFDEGKSKVIFRLIENRGKDSKGKERTVGVNCVCWSHGLNSKVIMPGLAKGCQAMVIGYFVDTEWQGQDGVRRFAKELVIERLRILEWAERDDQPLAA